MASWAEFEAAEPKFAARVRRLMTARKHLTMATIRRDGSPRISGTEVEIVGPDLIIGSPPGALKARDLERDPRVAIHGPTKDPEKSGRWRGEAKIAGRAIRARSKEGVRIFRIDISEVVITRLTPSNDRLVVEAWSPARGYREIEPA